MGTNSKISWTHSTFSPWLGCAKVSPGCDHCYAEGFGKRSGLVIWGAEGTRRVTSDEYWKQPLRWAKAARETGERRRVFPSLCDPFEDRADLVEPRKRFADLIAQTADALDWLLLTKRPENFGLMPIDIRIKCWLGVTAEDQQRADERIPLLLKATAAVRFVSAEPLLSSIDFARFLRKILLIVVGSESGHHARPSV